MNTGVVLMGCLDWCIWHGDDQSLPELRSTLGRLEKGAPCGSISYGVSPAFHSRFIERACRK